MKAAWFGISVACVFAATCPARAGTTADARALGNNIVGVTIDNAVVSNTTDLINSINVKNIHIQDAFGGITVFGGNADIDALLGQLAEGDTITLTGTTSSFFGVFELTAPFTLVNQGVPGIVVLSSITLADLQDGSARAELLESTLVRLDNVTFVTPGGDFAGSSNVSVTDGTLIGTVRIATTALSMVGTQIPSGTVSIIGILSQFDGAGPLPGVPGTGYQLQPRGLLDIITPGSPPVASNVTAIVKLNTASQDLTLQVADVDNDPFDIIVESIPTTGIVLDNSIVANVIEISLGALPYIIQDPLNPVVTFVPAAGVGTDMSFLYRGRQTTNGASGATGTASLQVQDNTVVITEVMYDPAGVATESQWEWVEIYNQSTGTLTLGELQSNTCPGSICGMDLVNGLGQQLVIGPGEIKVIVGTPSVFFGGVLRTDQDFLDKWGLTAPQAFFPATAFPFLSNGGNQLFLRDAAGDLIDFVTNFGGPTFPPDTNGLSINLNLPTLDNDDGLNWSLAVASCATGFKTVSDGSVGSPGVVPTAALNTFTPCADSALALAQAGAPTTHTFTLSGVLGPNAPAGATLGFKITKLPFVEAAGLLVNLGELHDGPTAGGALLGVGSVVADPQGRVTLVENLGLRQFITFRYKAIEKDSGGVPTGVESNAGEQTVAAQSNTVVITEIMANPANTSGGSETYWEYLEVTNTGTTPITLGSVQATNGPSGNALKLDTFPNPPVPNITILPGATRIIARDALDCCPGTIRTRAQFEAEWSTAPLLATDVVYVPNATGANRWDSLSNAPSAPGRFLSVWDDTNDFERSGLLDVVIYQIGQNGWPANTEPNSIFYRGDANGAPFTTLGNDLAANWQESTPGCAGDGSFDSFVDIPGGDSTVDHGSPLALPTNPNQCIPSTCVTCLGDLSGPAGIPDGKVDGLDIKPFIDIVLNPSFPAVGCADMNGDANGLNYLPDVPLFVDALVFGSTNCPVTTTHSTSVTIDLLGAPVAGSVELFIGGCDPTVPCNTLATPSFICFETVAVTPATTAAGLATALAFGADGIKNGIGGLDEFCLADGADVNVAGSTISIVFTRAAGLEVPCCYVQDTDGAFSNVSPFNFMLIGGPSNCAVSNLLNGTPGDEAAAHASGFRFTKTGN